MSTLGFIRNKIELVPAKPRAYFLLTLTALTWGCNAVFGRLAVGEVSPMALVAFRWLGVLLLLALLARGTLRADWPRLKPHLPFLAAMGALGYAGFNALFYIAAHTTTAINIGIIQGSTPLFVLLGALAVYRTPITPLQLLGVALAMLGVAVVASGGEFERLASLAVARGDLLMVLACMIHASYTVALRRCPQASALALFGVFAAGAFIAALPLAAAEAALGSFQWPTPTGWLVILLVVLLPSFLGQICFMQGIQLIGPGRAGIFVNLVPVFASILAVVILSEPFHLFHAGALGLVFGGIGLSERAKALGRA